MAPLLPTVPNYYCYHECSTKRYITQMVPERISCPHPPPAESVGEVVKSPRACMIPTPLLSAVICSIPTAMFLTCSARLGAKQILWLWGLSVHDLISAREAKAKTTQMVIVLIQIPSPLPHHCGVWYGIHALAERRLVDTAQDASMENIPSYLGTDSSGAGKEITPLWSYSL